MSDANSPIVRLFGPEEIPVRIPDWPEGVGVAVCRAGGKTLSFQPYHTGESGMALRKRLPAEAGAALNGFLVYPAMRGIGEAKLSYSDDQRIVSELEHALRSMPLLVEAVADFAINFEFAEDEGIGLDALNDSARRAAEASQAQKPRDQIPVGYLPFIKPDPTCEMISGAMLRPAGAAGVDLILAPDRLARTREMAAEVTVMVREDSLRVAIPLAGVLVNGALPAVVRLPVGALMMGQSAGKPVPAWVLRRGAYLFVAPDYSAVSTAPTLGTTAKQAPHFPWTPVILAVCTVVVIAAAAVAAYVLLPSGEAPAATTAPVDNLRSTLFSDE